MTEGYRVFPFSIAGRIPIHALDGRAEADVIDAIRADLARQQIKCEVEGSDIVFKNWSFAVWSLSRYAVVESGRFTIHSECVEYSLSTRMLFILATAMFMLAALLLWPVSNLLVATKFAIAGGLWLYFFCANYLLIWFRTRRFLQKLIHRLEIQ
ncbi:MAG: hypothetical protein K2Y40_07400 [Reyranella sp.]|nr:hypothetical protein [Reyranella sp.]